MDRPDALERVAACIGFAPAAVIFDMDGVLADTEPINRHAHDLLLARRGLEMTDDDFEHLIGFSNDASWRWLIDRFDLGGTPETLTAEYVEQLLPLLVAGCRPAPGAVELVRSLADAGVPIAVASASARGAVDGVIAVLGLSDAFNVVVSDADVRVGKPAPDIFLLAATRLGVEPSRCVVIEDSVNGIAAATAAGMASIGLRTRYNAPTTLATPAVIDSLLELVPQGVAQARRAVSRKRG